MMAKVKFTAGRVESFACASDRIPSFFWDAVAPGLGLRVTPAGAKSYIFQAKLKGKVIRITIGDPLTWDIGAAQREAARLRVMIDGGQDPRQVKADRLAAENEVRVARATAEVAALKAEEDAVAAAERKAVTMREVWPIYVADRIATRKDGWSEHHINAHRKMIQAGGETRKRSKTVTTAGPLASLAELRLVDLTSDRIEQWAKSEAKVRPSSGRLAMRLLKAFLKWCSEQKQYAEIVDASAAKSTKAREMLGKPGVRRDLLQREQLLAWFASVKKIGNPVISAYLQTLLLVGPRREELAALRWSDVDFQWNSLRLNDKVEDFRVVPLTPYVAQLLAALPRRNEWVFSSPAAESGRLAEPRHAHNQAVAIAGIPHLTLHGLRRSFATLSEWIEAPAGIAAQIQGHAPQGTRETNYIHRPLDLLRMWHVKIEAWILEQAGVQFSPSATGLRVVTA